MQYNNHIFDKIKYISSILIVNHLHRTYFMIRKNLTGQFEVISNKGFWYYLSRVSCQKGPICHA